MARIEIDLSEDLLEWVDEYAGRAGETRAEFLRRVIAAEIDRCHARLRKEIEDLLDSHPLDLGGKTAAELIRESRDSR
jgi:predicted DNA-binding protein